LNDLSKPIGFPGSKPRRRVGGNDGDTGALSREREQLRSDGRPYDTGMVRPYRPCPSDFRDRFLEMGWDGIEDHYHTNTRVIRRWIEQSGGDELRAERRKVSGGTPRPALRAENRRKRYVLGKTLTPKRQARPKRPKPERQPKPAPIIDPIEPGDARARYRELHGSTRKQRYGWAVRRVAGDTSLHQAIIAARDGRTLDEAAADIGIQPDGLRHLLRRKLGSGAWPPDLSAL